MKVVLFTERPFPGNPWMKFEYLHQDMNLLSRRFFGNERQLHGQPTVFPPLNIYENKNRLLIMAKIPGVTADDLEVFLERDTISLQGKRAVSCTDNSILYHKREIESGAFSRTIVLPVKIAHETVSAKLSNGILKISLDKAAAEKPRQLNVITE